MTQALQAAGWREQPGAASPPSAGVVHAQRGDHLADIAARYGLDEAALRAANPNLGASQQLAAGQALRLPEAKAELNAAVAGVAGATGREGLVQALQAKAYEAGRVAPQTAFDGTLHRALPSAYEAGALNHNYGSPGRYNAPGQGMLYTSPDAASMLHENAAYAGTGQHPLAGKTVLELGFKATPDAAGRGGVADLAEGARRAGLPEQALTEPKGGKSPSLLHQLAGEHPYTLPQQASKGASDAGASALRAPSATGGSQIDILPRNTRPDQIRPQQLTRHDAAGKAAPAQPATGVIDPMPADTRRYTPGALDKSAGARPALVERSGGKAYAPTDAPGRPLAAGNQSLEAPAGTAAGRLRQAAGGATEGYPRAASTRYGAVGGAAATLIDAGVRASRGEQVAAGQVAQATASNAVLGAGAAKAVDALTPRLGLVKAGGAVGALVQAGFSGYGNAQAYRAGQISGARAVANTVVDTGTAAAAGAAGAAVGAAVGSIVPVAGTAVGAVVGFGVGVGAHYAIGALDKATGFTSAAKGTLAAGLQSLSDGAGSAWKAIKAW
ncbi:LysM domain-containing protein [Paucibacter sp. APW11]|uniref:LysM domain-containing protein n=1 Tax=Roseateles aquae TaxID=3077235 RepID=A0ABU3PF57_9BURK|nr:LysM domain-containing protein [Paucibacter sp. APW11]MDT9000927.1 LysM domain-containing protein [Paucibacter sp. APW11]